MERTHMKLGLTYEAFHQKKENSSKYFIGTKTSACEKRIFETFSPELRENVFRCYQIFS